MTPILKSVLTGKVACIDKMSAERCSDEKDLITQIWSWYSIFVVRSQQTSYKKRNFMFRGENGSITTPVFSDKLRELCFGISELNIKTIIHLNRAEYPLVEVNSV